MSVSLPLLRLVGPDALAVLAPVLVAAQAPAVAPKSADAERAASKRGFTLFRATPKALMRDFATDRPDKTESPYTVDAGRVQVEMDMLSYSHDRTRTAGLDETITGMAVSPLNVKLGLRHDMDLHFVIEPHVRERTRVASAGGISTQRWTGAGDLTMRLKVNAWGNDGGRTALAVMPFVSLARAETGERRQLAAGVILPLAVDLGGGWGFGTMAEFDVEKHATAAPYHVNGVLSATIGRELSGRLNAYTELWALEGAFTDFTATWDAGLTFALLPDVQLDGGLNVGLTRAADVANPFLGLTFRF